MKTWRFFWRLMLFRPWPFWINCTCITLVFLVEMVPGFVARAFFNRLSAHGHGDLGLWWLITLLIMAALGTYDQFELAVLGVDDQVIFRHLPPGYGDRLQIVVIR